VEGLDSTPPRRWHFSLLTVAPGMAVLVDLDQDWRSVMLPLGASASAGDHQHSQLSVVARPRNSANAQARQAEF
jgi:hypothetical protein